MRLFRTTIAASCLSCCLAGAGAPPPEPEITVIDDGPPATTLTDGQAGVIDFGCTMPGSPVSRTFTVRNDGSADLFLPSNGLTLPAGFSQIPGWPTALITPEFKVVVKKENGAASAVDFTSFELVTMPDILSITAITLRIPAQWIQLNNMGTPDSQTPFFDGDTPFVIDPGATSGLDVDEVPGGGWFCDPPGAQNNPNGDICVEFGGLEWNQGQQNRYSEATLRFTPGAFSGTLDNPSQNDDLTFGYGVVGLNNPRVPDANNDGEAFWEAGLEVDVVLFNSETNSSETVSGFFVDDGDPTNGIAEATLQATPVVVPIPVTIPSGQTWLDVIGSPFTVQLDGPEGSYLGDFSLENNDADEAPFNFPISGIVDGTPPDIVNLPANIVEPADGASCKAMVSWTPPSVVDVLDPNPTITQSMGLAPGSIFEVGDHTIEYTAVDCAGNVRVASFTVSVIDQEPPTLVDTLPKRIIANAAPGETSVIVNFGPFAAIDNCDLAPVVDCTPGPGIFNLGATEVCCVARDSSGNESPQQCFDVIVIQAQEVGSLRAAEVVIERNIPAPGAANAKLFNANHAFLNEAGSVVLEVQMLDAGPNNVALFKDIGGGLELVSRKGDLVPGIGLAINRYDDLSLSELGAVGFEGFLGGATSTTDAFHGSDVSGGVASGVREGDTAPLSTAIFESLREPAFDGAGNMISPAYLAIGPGGVTVSSNTGIWRKPAAGGPLEQVALEGAAVGSAIPGASFGQVESRVVANASGQIAFYAFLDVDGTIVTLNDNTVILSGLPGSLSVVSREGDIAPDSDGALFEKYAAESINNDGRVAFKAGLKTGTGSPVTSANRTGVYTNSNGPVQLVAREGDLAPCLGTNDVFFSDFREIFIADNGDVYFHVFLTGPQVGSDTDGSFWLWKASDATLHPILREGDVAPSTAGAEFNWFDDFAVSNDGIHAVSATLVPGTGDCELSNNYGLWMDNGSAGLPILQLREGDEIVLGEVSDTFVNFIRIDATTNWAGGSGGIGKVLNDDGDIIVQTSFNNNTSGVVILSNPPPPPGP